MKKNTDALFHFCPSCGGPHICQEGRKRLYCPDCCFEYFHNVATATGLILVYKERVVLTRRNLPPALGKLSLPGGFAEPGESADEAALRECREEIGLQPRTLRYLASYPNNYLYKNVLYSSCDIFYTAKLRALNYTLQEEEISELILVDPEKIDYSDIAFPSVEKALKTYCARFR